MFNIKYLSGKDVPHIKRGAVLEGIPHNGVAQSATVVSIHPSGAFVLSFRDGSTCIARVSHDK